MLYTYILILYHTNILTLSLGIIIIVESYPIIDMFHYMLFKLLKT